jgi:peroxiredoxin Q/BCP
MDCRFAADCEHAGFMGGSSKFIGFPGDRRIFAGIIARIATKEPCNMPIPSGVPAPEFELLDDTRALRKLSDHRGKNVVLYFYPKDDTPGCTKEACSFRDDYSAFERAGVDILGVSPDSVESHVKFKRKHQLPFPLLADEDHRVCDLYGVWGPKKFMGKEYEGVLRTTFLIDAQGNIKRVFENVRPAEHSAELLAELGLK